MKHNEMNNNLRERKIRWYNILPLISTIVSLFLIILSRQFWSDSRMQDIFYWTASSFLIISMAISIYMSVRRYRRK